MEPRERLAKELTDRMLRAGYNQTSLASKSGVSVATIRKLQNAVDQGYELATIYRLADVLGFDPEVMSRLAHGDEDDRPLISAAGLAGLRVLIPTDEGELTADEINRRARAAGVPEGTAALSGIDMSDLTPEEREQVRGYIDALRERRRGRA